jgi:hypothetical protein
MKELNPLDQLKDKVEDRLVIPEQKEYHLIGKMILKPNQNLYSVNLVTGEVKLVHLTKQLIFNSRETHSRANMEAKCIYYAAYNIKQVKKHFTKQIQKIYDKNILRPGDDRDGLPET